jgi:hypothetical protein
MATIWRVLKFLSFYLFVYLVVLTLTFSWLSDLFISLSAFGTFALSVATVSKEIPEKERTLIFWFGGLAVGALWALALGLSQ